MGSSRGQLVILAIAFIVLISAPVLAKELSYFYLGIIEWKKGNYEEAIEYFTREIKVNPANHNAYYNLALVYEQAGEPFKAYSTWGKYLELTPPKLWAEKARKHIERLEGSGVFKGLVVEEVKVDDLFPSIYKYYTTHPIGHIVLKNMSKGLVQDIKVSFKVERYMDNPTGSEIVKELMPEEGVKIDLYATFNNLIMELTEDTPVQSSIYLSYQEGGEKIKSEPITQTITIYNRNAMTWNPPKKLSSFITLRDEPIMAFSGDIARFYGDDEPSFIPENIYKAMLVFNVLSTYGLKYVPDPFAPVRADESEKLVAIDYIQYPVDTLRLRKGDCDDGVVIFTAILESMGISTAFVDFPDHVYPMFDTGISPKEAYRVNPLQENYIVRRVEGKESLWVPLETTLWNKSFSDVWASAMERYYKTPDFQQRIIDIWKAWRVYNPATLIYTGGAPVFQLPSKEEVDRLMARDTEEQYKVRVNYITKSNQDLINAKVDKYKAHNKLGAIYGKYKLYDEAIDQFKKALELRPDYIRARVNLGYAYYLKEMYEDALRELELALEAQPTASRYYNVAKIYYQHRQYDKARENLKKAIEINPSYQAKLKEMPTLKYEETGAKAEGPLPELEIIWEVEM